MAKPNREPISWDVRDFLPMPAEIEELKLIANQSHNHKSYRPALFLIWYAAGESKEKILSELGVSEASLERWWTRWVEDGLDGLRHLSPSSIDKVLDELGTLDPKLARRARAAIRRARE